VDRRATDNKTNSINILCCINACFCQNVFEGEGWCFVIGTLIAPDDSYKVNWERRFLLLMPTLNEKEEPIDN
jgi:hypothetical protein